jgi:ankyrin repeat protein
MSMVPSFQFCANPASGLPGMDFINNSIVMMGHQFCRKTVDLSSVLDGIQKGNFKDIQDFLDLGLDPNMKDDNGTSLLAHAIAINDRKSFRLLLSYGADVNEGDLLHLAVKNRNIEMIQILLENKIDVNKKNSKGVSPIFTAAEDNQVEIVRWLLNYGADPDIEATHHVCRQGNLEIAKILIEQGKVNLEAEDRFQMTPLHWAALSTNVDLIKYLIKNKASLHHKNVLGRSIVDDLVINPETADVLFEYLPNSTRMDSQLISSFQEKLLQEKVKETMELYQDPKITAAFLAPRLLNQGSSGSYIIKHCNPQIITHPALRSHANLFTKTLALYKPESSFILRDSIRPGSGSLREKLSYILSNYLSEKAKLIPSLSIKDFQVPLATIATLNLPSKAHLPSEAMAIIQKDDQVKSDTGALINFAHNSIDVFDLPQTEIPKISADEWIKLKIFDVLASNTDRQIRNIRVRKVITAKKPPTYQIIPIDHDLTFANTTAFKNSELLTHNEAYGMYTTVLYQPLSEDWKRFIESLDPKEIWERLDTEIQEAKKKFPDMRCDITSSNQLAFIIATEILKQTVARGGSLHHVMLSLCAGEDSLANKIAKEAEDIPSESLFAKVRELVAKYNHELISIKTTIIPLKTVKV